MAKENDDDLLIFSGAGISKPLGIPDMYSFVEEFESEIEKGMGGKKDLLDKIINNEKIDLEELLRRLNRMSELLEDETYLRMVNPGDDEKMIFSEIKELKEKLMDFVYEKCSSFDEEVAQRIFKQLLDLKDLFLHDRLKIFTTNYDICAESTYEKQNIACTTGFKMIGMYPIWDRTAFKDPSYEIHIYKLHGSITWFKHGDQITQLPPIDRKISSQFKCFTRSQERKSLNPPSPSCNIIYKGRLNHVLCASSLDTASEMIQSIAYFLTPLKKIRI
jgi:hypothetical protein